jgi:hypothetical protein
MAYPANPPTTEAAVQIAARRQALRGSAITIGISMTSGGIGKTELSTKDTAASAPVACFVEASRIVQS